MSLGSAYGLFHPLRPRSFWLMTANGTETTEGFEREGAFEGFRAY